MLFFFLFSSFRLGFCFTLLIHCCWFFYIFFLIFYFSNFLLFFMLSYSSAPFGLFAAPPPFFFPFSFVILFYLVAVVSIIFLFFLMYFFIFLILFCFLFFVIVLLLFFFFFFFFLPHHTACGILVPRLEVGPKLLYWGLWVQTTGLTENLRPQGILIGVRPPGGPHFSTKSRLYPTAGKLQCWMPQTKQAVRQEYSPTHQKTEMKCKKICYRQGSKVKTYKTK